MGFAQENDIQIKKMLEQKKYFRLQEDSPKWENSTSDFMKLYAQAMLKTYFNKPQEAIRLMERIYTDYAQSLDAQSWVDLLTEFANNYAKVGEVALAAYYYDYLINNVAQYVDADMLQGLKIHQQYLQEMIQFPNFSVEKNTTSNFPFRRDNNGMLMMPVVFNSDTIDLVLDFGTGISMIHEQYAEKLGIVIQEDSILAENGVKIGYAKELFIGGLSLKNVPFLISKDSSIDETTYDYEVKGIIGLSVLLNLEKMSFNKENVCKIEKTEPSQQFRPNIVLINDKIYVNVNGAGDNLLMQLDPNVPRTYLNKNYYEKNEYYVGSTDKRKISKSDYFGTTTYDSYLLKDFQLIIGLKNTMLNIEVIIRDEQPEPFVDGVIGYDILGRNNEMIIDFINMTLEYR